MRYWLAGLIWIVPLLANATGSDTLWLSQVAPRSYLFDYATVTDTPLETSLAEVQQRTTAPRLTQQTATRADRAYWLRCLLGNDSEQPQTLFVYTSTIQHATFYVQHASYTDTLRAGTMMPRPDWNTDDSDQYVRFSLRPHETITLYVRVANAPGWLGQWWAVSFPPVPLRLLLEREASHFQRRFAEIQRNLPELQYRSGLQGALFFFALFVGLLYSRYRQRIYRYYWLYVLAGCAFAFLKTRSYTPLGQWLSYAPLLRTHLLEPVMWFGLGAYLFFVIELLDLPAQHPNATRWLRRLAWISVGYGLVYGLFMVLTNDGWLPQFMFWKTRLLLIPVYAGVLFWMARHVRSPLVRYVVAGNTLMAVVGILAWLRAGGLLLNGVKLPAHIDDLLTVSFAVLLEMLVFALALARRIQWLDDERDANQQAYIAQLDANRRLTLRHNSDLAAQVKQKTAETLDAFRQLESQRLNQVRSDYEKRLADLEMLALRSQMNPHFLFNSLNTLEYFILSGNEQKASAYLAAFSRLLRIILTQSREETITLADELATLKLYVEVEAPRFGSDFQYVVKQDPTLLPQHIPIPPMLLQPFVENAIWHGLMPSERTPKQLTIDIRPGPDQTLLIDIIDNGIGRHKAAQLKQRSRMQRKSLGLDIMQQRVDLFNLTYSSQIRIGWNDLPNGGGTIVQISYHFTDETLPTHARHPD